MSKKIYAIPIYHNTRRYSAITSYAIVHAAASGNGSVTSPYVGQEMDAISYRKINRAGMQWDLSAVPSLVGKANSKIILYSCTGGGYSVTVHAVSGASLANPMVNADYGDLRSAVTGYGSVALPIAADFAPYTINLDSSGLAIIAVGSFFFGFRSSDDISITDNIATPNTSRLVYCGTKSGVQNMLDTPTAVSIGAATATIRVRVSPYASSPYVRTPFLYLEVDGTGSWSNTALRVAYKAHSSGTWLYTDWQDSIAWEEDVNTALSGLSGDTLYDAKIQFADLAHGTSFGGESATINFTTAGTIKKRVSGIRHVYRPGSYRSEVTFGDITTTVSMTKSTTKLLGSDDEVTLPDKTIEEANNAIKEANENVKNEIPIMEQMIPRWSASTGPAPKPPEVKGEEVKYDPGPPNSDKVTMEKKPINLGTVEDMKATLKKKSAFNKYGYDETWVRGKIAEGWQPGEIVKYMKEHQKNAKLSDYLG